MILRGQETTTSIHDRINEHPLNKEDIVEIVMRAWNGIMSSKIGGKALIGIDIFPKPQFISMLLHDLIAIELSEAFPGKWKGDESKNDKDLVYLPDDTYSIEIKTSSSDFNVFGNRSYVKSDNATKERSSYFLIINYQQFSQTQKGFIKSIRFGYLDASDWIPQKKESGQQCRLSNEAKRTKLVELYHYENKS